MKNPKVVIGVPHLGDLPEYFVKSLLGLNKADYYVVFAENAPVDLARNSIVEAMLERADATHLFFMDADMVFPAEALEALLAMDRPIASGTYFARTDTPVPHAYRFSHTDEDGVLWYTPLAAEFAQWMKAHPEQADRPNAYCFPERFVVEADAVGAGCLLIRRDVLEAVYAAHSESYYPWFKMSPGTKGGEDFEFCRRAAELGYRTWVDFGVQCNHRASGMFLGREDFGACFGVGLPDEHDFAQPLLVEIGPAGDRRVRRQPLAEVVA